jgi:hypothetical protein
MYSNQYRDVFTTIAHGFHVARSTAALPQSTTGHLFQVTGGRVLITLLFGEVTTAIQNSDPVAKVTSTPTTGSAVDIASTVDLSSHEIGGLIIAEGDTTALIKVNAGGGGPANAMPWICPIGYVDLITSASKTGNVKWDLWYLPLDEGAAVAAV